MHKHYEKKFLCTPYLFIPAPLTQPWKYKAIYFLSVAKHTEFSIHVPVNNCCMLDVIDHQLSPQEHAYLLYHSHALNTVSVGYTMQYGTLSGSHCSGYCPGFASVTYAAAVRSPDGSAVYGLLNVSFKNRKVLQATVVGVTNVMVTTRRSYDSWNKKP